MTTPTQPDPAAELRAAAALIRERSGAATAGPWHYNDETVCRRNGDFYGHDVVQQTANPDTIICGTGEWRGGDETQPDAAWIALMNPSLGEALAVWLERAAHHEDATVYAATACWPDDKDKAERDAWAASMVEHEAVAVARLILGGAS